MKKKLNNIRKFFKGKKIIFSRTLQPGELVKIFDHKGKRYVRISFTNRQKFKGMMPTTDILRSNITAIRTLPSPFKKWLYRCFGAKARATFYKINSK